MLISGGGVQLDLHAGEVPAKGVKFLVCQDCFDGDATALNTSFREAKTAASDLLLSFSTVPNRMLRGKVTRNGFLLTNIKLKASVIVSTGSAPAGAATVACGAQRTVFPYSDPTSGSVSRSKQFLRAWVAQDHLQLSSYRSFV
jgi:hypothetical protein